MNDAALAIAATEAKHQMEGKTFSSLEDRCRAAMRATKDHWMVTDQDTQFRAAVGAVLMTCAPEEKEIIEGELRVLRMLGAASQGVPVDFSQMNVPEKAVGLSKLWRDIQAETPNS